MKEPEETNSYTIDINNNQYTFSCTDGDEYVKLLTKKLKEAIEAASNQDPGQVLSKYGIKIALLLADEVIREKISREEMRQEMDKSLNLMISQLEEVLASE